MLNTTSEIQRRLPFTDFPMPGINTNINSTTPITNNTGAYFCHFCVGTMNAATATARPIAMNRLWRTR